MTDLFEWSEDRARAAASLGMQRAVDHADAVVPSWSEQAGALLIEYALSRRAAWMVEDLRLWAAERGLPNPPDGRAWGAVVQRAARAGTIVRVGYQPAKSSNLSPKCLWLAGPT